MTATQTLRRRLVKPLVLRRNRLRARLEGRILNWLAKLRRPRLTRTTFIGITGSCGKSTTTVFTGAILSTLGECQVEVDLNPNLRSRAIWRLDASTRFCVHEVHAAVPGDVAKQLYPLQPTIGAVTTIGGDHYKSYRNLEATAREKGLLIESLPETGVAILNADDPNVLGMAARARARVITYGCREDADLRATNISATWPNRLSFTVSYGGESVRVETKLLGAFWATSILAAIGIGIACGVDLATCAAVTKNVEPVFGRYAAHTRSDGAEFVLDTNKAPVWTIAQALAFVEQAKAPRKTMIFGTLSDYSGQGSTRYRRVARDALKVADRVIFVGTRSGHVERLGHGLEADRLLTFQTTFQASEYMSRAVSPGELVYIKGTIKEHLERIMLAQLDRVVCWEEWCARLKPCIECGRYRIPQPPPFSVVAGAGNRANAPVAREPNVKPL